MADRLRLRRLFERMRDGVLAEVLRNALRDQQQRVNKRAGDEDVERSAGHIDPEVADGRRRGALDATNQRDSNHDARGRRPEVVRGQAEHLSQIAHGAFRRVELPIGVGGKTGGGVPGQIGAYVASPCGLRGRTA